MKNRTYKFRAWDKKRKRMTPPFDFRQWEGNKLYPSNYDVCYFGDLELMQYTGLKDKNGKEIYHFDWLKDNDVIVQIDWYGDRWDYAILEGAYREQPRLLDLVKRAEIVGNKYEG